MIENLHFIRPEWLFALLPIAILLAFLFRYQDKQKNAWHRVVDAHLFKVLSVKNSAGKKNNLAFYLLALASLITVIALAGPSFKKHSRDAFVLKQTHYVLLDLSPSMNINDVNPSRLKRAIFTLKDFLKKKPDDIDIALMAFAGEPYLITPATADTKNIETLINDISTDILPKTGSRLDLALDYVQQLIKQAPTSQNHVLLLTDIEAVKPQTLNHLETLAQNNVSSSVIGIATRRGAPIYAGQNLLKANGQVVISQLNEPLLKKLAQTGNGFYQNLLTSHNAIDNYLAFSQQKNQQHIKEKQQESIDDWQDLGIWFTLILLPIALFAFRRGYLLTLIVFFLVTTNQPISANETEKKTKAQTTWQDLWQTDNQQGQSNFDEKNYSDAAKKFTIPDWQAASLYKAGQYQKAQQIFAQLNQFYNEGNALAAMGELTKALSRYQKVPENHPDYDKAQYNIEVIKAYLKEQAKQNQSQNQSQNQQSNNENGENNEQNNQDDKQSNQNNQKSQENNSQQDKHNNSNQQGENDQLSEREKKQLNEQGKQKQAEQNNEKEDEKSTKKDASKAQQKINNEQDNGEKKQDNNFNKRSDADVLSSENSQQVKQLLNQLSNEPQQLLKRKFYIERAYRQQENSPLYNKSESKQW